MLFAAAVVGILTLSKYHPRTTADLISLTKYVHIPPSHLHFLHYLFVLMIDDWFSRRDWVNTTETHFSWAAEDSWVKCALWDLRTPSGELHRNSFPCNKVASLFTVCDHFSTFAFFYHHQPEKNEDSTIYSTVKSRVPVTTVPGEW